MSERLGKMTAQSVCAVIVTYHPGTGTLEHISKVLAQVQGLVIVDNGSSADEIASLQAASQRLGFRLIENGENLGIAQALNQGVLWAKGQGYPWVVLFDQDSSITDGFMVDMFAAWQAHPERERVASIHPTYVDREQGPQPVLRRTRDGGPVASMTSGALMPTWIFDKIGPFASEYFIDCVDDEYCFRIRAAGYYIADSRQAQLLHCPGQPRAASFLGFRFRPTHHSAMRRYYMSRNRLVLYRTYFRPFPRWTLQWMYDGFKDAAKCFLGEQDRARKFRSFVLGTWDGLTGKMGRRDNL
jgi:rhamnosyltransferase